MFNLSCVNTIRLIFLVLVLGIPISLFAQQAETNKETFAEIKAKAESGNAQA
jgi:hypothetical protein